LLISRGNLKLGSLPSFSLPVVTTCPGMTPFCEAYCYGFRGNFTMSNVKEANDRRLDATFRSDFVDIIIKEIRQTRAPAFRLHVIGDFYSVEYIEKWGDIVKALPAVIFFGSTRSWRCTFLSEALRMFRDMENVFMKASIDLTDTSSPPSSGWNVWSIEGKEMLCPHDEGKVANCLECKRCWSKKNLDVTFKLRWGDRADYLASNLFN